MRSRRDLSAGGRTADSLALCIAWGSCRDEFKLMSTFGTRPPTSTPNGQLGVIDGGPLALSPREPPRGIYYSVLRAGRWLAREHPTVLTPDARTRDLCIAYVAAVNDARVGDLAGPNAYAAHRPYPDAPLAPRSKATVIRSLRLFFRDLQEWGWCPRSFNPQRALATPRSIRALIGPDPRVIADELWAKLLWAGIHLEEQDLPKTGRLKRPKHARPMYPIALVRALVPTWLFAGLRSDELVRLRVGCIRWQRGNASPAAATKACDP